MFVNRNREFLRFVVANEPTGGSATPETQPEPDAPEASTEASSTEPQPEPEPVWDPARAAEKIRKQNQENASLRAAKKAAEEAATSATDRAKELEQTAAKVPDLEVRLLRTEIALEYGIPAAIAKRLLGSTREEVMADAEQLLADITPKAPPKTGPRPVESLQPGSGTAPAAPTAADQIAAAEKAGDWATAMALKSTQLADLPRPT